MKFKKIMLIIIMAIFLASIAGVCASDANGTIVAVDDVNQTDSDSNFVLSDSESGSLDVQEESVSSVGDADQTDSDSIFSRVDSECCSFVIQEENETVFAFRQDAPVNGSGVVIHNESLGDMEFIVQEIDSPTNHFIHAVITEDGWVFGHGGDSSNLNDTVTIENLAFDMLTSKVISNDYIRQINNIFDKYDDYGHFFIKAPDGRFAVAFGEAYITGTLKPGEFLVIPNLYSGYRKGNYNDYAMDPVDAIVEICSYEDTGTNRSNLYSYDYKAHHTANGQKYGVDIYVTNDNGHNVGLNTSEIVTYCYFNDTRYQQSVIPQNPDKLQIATHIFEKQSINSNIEVVSSRKIVYIGKDPESGEFTDRYYPVRFKINNIVDEKTVVFDIDGENVEFINAVVFQGNYTYDSTQHKVYWNLPATDSSKEIILSVMPKAKGSYKIRAHIDGIDEEVEVTSYATNEVAILKVEDVTTYKSYFKSMMVYLTDEEGVPYIGEKVSITINGTTYSRKVTNNGYAALAIMLQPGEYDVRISYATEYFDNETTSKIIVKKTLFSENLVMSYGDDTSFDVYCLDERGNTQISGEVDFYMDGVMRTRFTDYQGIASLNLTKLHLEIGNHTITSFNVRTNEYVTNWIYVYDPKTELEAKAVTATYNVNKDLVVTLKDSLGNPINGADISVDLNGIKNYVTDSNGQINVSTLGLTPKVYTVNIAFEGNDNYDGSNATTTVTINKAKTQLTADEVITIYNSNKDLVITLKDSTGKSLSGFNITVDLNGTKNYTTDASGQVRISTKGLAANIYEVRITFNGTDKYLNCSNTTTVSIYKESSRVDTKPLTTDYNVHKYLVVGLKDNEGNPICNADAYIEIHGVTYKCRSDEKGDARLIIRLNPGTYTAKITFDNVNYTGFTQYVTVIVKKLTPKLTAAKKTFKKSVKTKKYTVTLKANNKALAKVKLTLKVKGKTYKAKTNAKGKATFKIKKLTKKGTFKAVIKFKGNKYYKAVTKKVKIKIK